MKLTEAQRRVLGDVRHGRISWSRLTLSYWNHTSKSYVRKPTVQALLDRRLIARSERDDFMDVTHSGLAALQEAQER